MNALACHRECQYITTQAKARGSACVAHVAHLTLFPQSTDCAFMQRSTEQTHLLSTVMAILHGISVTLQSSNDAAILPETTTSPHPHHGHELAAAHTAKATNVANVQVPTHRSGNIWICYACPQPRPQKSEVRFYYFKLYLTNQHVVSWGVASEISGVARPCLHRMTVEQTLRVAG